MRSRVIAATKRSPVVSIFRREPRGEPASFPPVIGSIRSSLMVAHPSTAASITDEHQARISDSCSRYRFRSRSRVGLGLAIAIAYRGARHSGNSAKDARRYRHSSSVALARCVRWYTSATLLDSFGHRPHLPLAGFIITLASGRPILMADCIKLNPSPFPLSLLSPFNFYRIPPSWV